MAGRAGARLLKTAHRKPAADGSGERSDPGDERGAPGQPALAGSRLQLVCQSLPEARVHSLWSLAGGRKPGGHDDRVPGLGVTAAQLQAPAAQEPADNPLDTVLGCLRHPGVPWPPHAERAAA